MSRRRSSNDWDDLVAVPNPRVAPPQQARIKAVAVKILVWAVLVSFPILVFALAQTVTSVAPDVNSDEKWQAQKAVASHYMDLWLAGQDTPGRPPVPGGRLLLIGTATSLAYDLPAGSQEPDVTSVSVPFTLVDSAGQMWQTDVVVETDTAQNMAVASLPSLIPVSPNADLQTVLWPGMSTDSPPEPVAKAVQAWAEAWASGDPDSLRLAVGDPNPDHWYTPLAGVSQIVTQTVGMTEVDGERLVAARVQFAVGWAGQSVPEGNREPSFEMDVLVSAADTASPQVVGWGPAGSGPNLSMFGNAIDGTGRTLPEPSYTPTSTPSPAGGQGR